MNVHDDMSEDGVLRTAARSLSAVPMAAPPDVAAIMARGRVRRLRRLTGLVLGGTAAATVVALGVAGVFGGGPTPVNTSGTTRTTAFTLVKNTNGTATLTLSQHQVLNPAVLQQALARDGIPALVKIDTFCSSDNAPSIPAGVISLQLPDGNPVPTSSPSGENPVPHDAVMVINPAKMAAGTELTFNYLSDGHELHLGVIYTRSYTCGSGLSGTAGS
ncbi:MAG: hypothetical protein ABSB76_25865 [Streptosporangiaceae bacterium]|jgi:hypothetical protein